MKVIITGFDPFGGESINPSYEAVKLLPDSIDDIEIIKLELPTVAYKAINILWDAILKYSPDVVIEVGQAGGRSGISVERIAININDFRIPDNEGNQLVDSPVYSDGPAAYFSDLPIKKILTILSEKEVPASISNSAGTFVCNNLFYGVRHLISTHGLDIKSGFIHVPYIPEQSKEKPSMKTEDIAKALELIVLASRS